MRGALWLVLYLVVVVGPLFFMLVGGTAPGRGFWHELSIALGFVGLSLLGLQFATTARFELVDAPYGLDVVLRFHRQISLVAFAFVLAHPLILIPITELGSRPYQVWEWTATGATGVVALGLLVLLLGSSLWFKRLRLRYESWRILHGVLGIAIVLTSLVHILLSGTYVTGPFRTSLWVALTLGLVGLYARVRIVQPWRMRRRPWVVESVTEVADGAWELALRAEGHQGLRFQPGQFAWLTVGRSPFAIQENPFSLSSSAERPDRVTFTIKGLGDFTSTVGALAPGTRAYLAGPYGVFSYERNEASRFVFIAGGIGISPVMSMLRTLADRDDRRPLVLLYGAQTEDDLALCGDLDALTDRLDLTVVPVLEEPRDGWDGEVGMLTPDVLDRHLPPRDDLVQVFVCGPDAMMDAVEQALHDRGLDPDRVNLERFDLL
jgi:predicted ferric reductase